MLYEQLGLNKREAKDFIEEFFELITQQVAQGHDVKIAGFGNFQVRNKQARPGRNPKTGEPVIVDARRTVTFHASNSLKSEINEG